MKGLAAELQKMGVKNVIAAPAAGIGPLRPAPAHPIQSLRDSEEICLRGGIGDRGSGIEAVASFKEQDGIRVWRFSCSKRPGDLGEIYGEGDPLASESFKKVLDEEKPDIVHFHAWSPAVSILLVREVKRRGIRMVQTYHTPTLSCPRGTLMRWGRTVCDGDLARRPCALCAIHGKLRKGYRISDMGYGKSEAGYRISGAGKSSNESSKNPESQIRNPKESKLSALTSKLITMLRMPGLIRKRTEVVRELFRTADKIVALNQWTKELLRVNGVKEGKIEVIRHGIPETRARMPDSGGEEPPKFKIRNSEGALKLVFLGRVAPEKGIDVLLRAIEIVKIPVELDVYGIGSKDMEYGISDTGYWGAGGVRREAGGSKKPELRSTKSRILWLEPVQPEQVVETIRKYDALVVPSVWLETGPLVVLEAFAAGVPVIGSRLGGIAEMVRDGVDGLLFEAGSPEDLADKIQGFHRRMKNIKAGVPRVKNTREVGYEHLKLYQQLLSK